MKIMRPKGYLTQGLFDMVVHIEKVTGRSATDMKAVEVGCFAGESALIFGYHFRHIYCVDPWNNLPRSEMDEKYINRREDMNVVEKAFDKRMSVLDNFSKVKQTSTVAAQIFDDKSFDFVYIDADHRYRSVIRDIEAWLPKIKTGGFIGGHDYHRRCPGVINAVTNKFKKPDALFKDSSWIVQVRTQIQPSFAHFVKEGEVALAAA